MIFEPKKKYRLTIVRNGQELIFTATNVLIVGELLTFIDKNNQQFVFPISFLLEAKEAIE
jgi:hypothetical protein